VQGSDGNFYGASFAGGAYDSGTIFRISPTGSQANLYSFSDVPDGANPDGQLVQGSDGNFYGTTYNGGAYTNGSLFRISPTGNYTNLYSFNPDANDASYSYGGLVQGNDGNFYGTSSSGGDSGQGTVFRITPGGSYSNLHSFSGLPNGSSPTGALVQGSDDNFYGTTIYGGDNNAGTVFRISSSGSYTNLYSFSGPDGQSPRGKLVQGSDGNFYGVTWLGGSHGTIFRISPSGSCSNLFSFPGLPGGRNPYRGLVQGSDGNFYGTTYNGGKYNTLLQYGTVFRLSLPLDPAPFPINQITAVRVVGTNIVFRIPSIAGEKYQLQYRSSLTSGGWSNVINRSSIGGLLTITNFGGASSSSSFYRLKITP
jgi:uncharacterized repeat protein (TIGR03803 family)